MENLLVFDSTHQAMAIEALVKNQQLRARLIPTPETISAGCGLALKFAETDLEQIKQLTAGEKMRKAVFYQIMIIDGKKTFKKIMSMDGEI